MSKFIRCQLCGYIAPQSKGKGSNHYCANQNCQGYLSTVKAKEDN